MPGFVLVTPVTDESIAQFNVMETNIEKQQKGIVVAVGNSVINEWGVKMETTVVPGDVVFHRSWGHETINIDGKEYRVCRFLDICLKVEQ